VISFWTTMCFRVLSSRRIVIIFVWSAMQPKLWAQPKKAESIGTVLQVQGSWRITKESPALLPGQGVPAGALIKTGSAKKTDFLIVVLLNGKRLAVRCQTNPCATELQIPTYDADAAVNFQHVIEAVKYVLLNNRSEVVNAFSSTASRGENSVRSEMVSAFEPGKAVSIASVVPGIPRNNYTLELIRASDGKQLSARDLLWDPLAGQPFINLPAPGAYILLLKSAYQDVISDIFVLAVPSASYEHVKTSFEQARQMCSQWEGADAEGSTHLFLRAYLLALTTHNEAGRFR